MRTLRNSASILASVILSTAMILFYAGLVGDLNIYEASLRWFFASPFVVVLGFLVCLAFGGFFRIRGSRLDLLLVTRSVLWAVVVLLALYGALFVYGRINAWRIPSDSLHISF
jgi:hypothetical protein